MTQKHTLVRFLQGCTTIHRIAQGLHTLRGTFRAARGVIPPTPGLGGLISVTCVGSLLIMNQTGFSLVHFHARNEVSQLPPSKITWSSYRLETKCVLFYPSSSLIWPIMGPPLDRHDDLISCIDWYKESECSPLFSGPLNIIKTRSYSVRVGEQGEWGFVYFSIPFVFSFICI